MNAIFYRANDKKSNLPSIFPALYMKKSGYLIALAFGAAGCSHQTQSTDRVSTPTTADTVKRVSSPVKPIAAGMTDTVYASSDATIKYAVYTPPYYNTSKKYPIIYFFDPHGHGDLPLKLYKALADRYGFILAGSYNSKNGMAFSETDKIAQSFMQDSWQRLAIDNNRIYTSGFSGGALVASSIAIYDGGIAGVIACGSGFPVKNPQINTPFAFIGLVGEYDFHFTDMKMLDKSLRDSPLPHQLIVFHGTHQWAPVNTEEEAFRWLDVNAMKMHLIPKNDSLVKAIFDAYIKEAAAFEKKKNIPQEYFSLKKIENYLNGLTDLSSVTAKANELEKSEELQQYLADEAQAEQQELQEQSGLINSLSDRDLDWWEQTVTAKRKVIKTDSATQEAMEDKRLLNYMSLAAYMGASQAFKAFNDDATAHFLELYKLVDPSNPEHSYLYACIYARSNNGAKAISYLEDAVKLGFSDYRRMSTDSNFNALKNMPAYQELLKKMRGMPIKTDMTQ